MAVVAVTFLPATLAADYHDPTSWQNLQQLTIGRPIEVTKINGESLKGSFISFVDQSITLHTAKQEITIGRKDVSRVRLRSAKGRRSTWIGAAIGAGAGAGVGTGIGEHVADTSGGDFRNLKPAIIGASAGVGALVGAIVRNLIGTRHSTIYSSK